VDSRERVIEIVRRFFSSEWKELSLHDIRAIYLWGSIVRPDFDPSISDVDCVAMCGPVPPVRLIMILRDEARSEHKELARLNVRHLLMADFNGCPPQSDLAKILDPRLLLADFPSWIWVCGERLSLSNFALRPCSPSETYRLQLEALRMRMHRCLSVPRTEAPRHVLKAAGYLIHTIHKVRDGEHPFSYEDLESRSDPVTAQLAQIVVTLRSRDWPDDECEQAISLIVDLLNQIGGYHAAG